MELLPECTSRNAHTMTRQSLLRRWCRHVSADLLRHPVLVVACTHALLRCMQLASTARSQSREPTGHRLNQPRRRKHSRPTRLDDRAPHAGQVLTVWTMRRSCYSQRCRRLFFDNIQGYKQYRTVYFDRHTPVLCLLRDLCQSSHERLQNFRNLHSRALLVPVGF